MLSRHSMRLYYIKNGPEKKEISSLQFIFMSFYINKIHVNPEVLIRAASRLINKDVRKRRFFSQLELSTAFQTRKIRAGNRLENGRRMKGRVARTLILSILSKK